MLEKHLEAGSLASDAMLVAVRQTLMSANQLVLDCTQKHGRPAVMLMARKINSQFDEVNHRIDQCLLELNTEKKQSLLNRYMEENDSDEEGEEESDDDEFEEDRLKV